jgi:hypothetical protein
MRLRKDLPMTVSTPAVWTPGTPDERRRIAVAELVAHVLGVPQGQRYVAAYGTLSGLIASQTTDVSTAWARDFVTELEPHLRTQEGGAS